MKQIETQENSNCEKHYSYDFKQKDSYPHY